MLIKDKIPNFVHGENAPRRLRFTAVAIEEMADLLSLWAKEEDFLLRHDAFDLSMEQRSILPISPPDVPLSLLTIWDGKATNLLRVFSSVVL